MRDDRVEEPEYKVGDRRVVDKFLLFPDYDPNINKMRWLEWAKVVEELQMGYYEVYECNGTKWVEIAYDDTAE